MLSEGMSRREISLNNAAEWKWTKFYDETKFRFLENLEFYKTNIQIYFQLREWVILWGWGLQTIIFFYELNCKWKESLQITSTISLTMFFFIKKALFALILRTQRIQHDQNNVVDIYAVELSN